MRMWHVLVICLAYGIWRHYDYIGPHVVDPLLREAGITIPGISNRPVQAPAQPGSLHKNMDGYLSKPPATPANTGK